MPTRKYSLVGQGLETTDDRIVLLSSVNEWDGHSAGPMSVLGEDSVAKVPKCLVAITVEADRHVANVLSIIREAQKAGASTLRQIAAALNARGVATARGDRKVRDNMPLQYVTTFILVASDEGLKRH